MGYVYVIASGDGCMGYVYVIASGDVKMSPVTFRLRVVLLIYMFCVISQYVMVITSSFFADLW